jgi:hypothetical protein
VFAAQRIDGRALAEIAHNICDIQFLEMVEKRLEFHLFGDLMISLLFLSPPSSPSPLLPLPLPSFLSLSSPLSLLFSSLLLLSLQFCVLYLLNFRV